MTDLTTLIAKLEAATGPDRELDAEIAIALDQIASRDFWSIDYIKADMVPAVTGSIDAAVALAARVLPGWGWSTQSFGEDGAQGKVWKHGWYDGAVIYAEHSSPAIALVIAILRAKQAEAKA